MKCSSCGYVSFDELGTCKQCGTTLSLDDGPGSGAVGDDRLQEDLFSLRLDESPTDEERMEEGSPSEEGSGLLRLHPDEDGEVEEEAFQERRSWEETDTVIDDESRLPEDLWFEESAGFPVRLMAFAIDTAILAGVLSLFFAGAMLAFSTEGPGWWSAVRPGIPDLFLPFYLLALFLSVGYFTFFLGWGSTTPGKALMKLDVHCSDGGDMTFSRAFLRWVGYLFSLTCAGMGFLWILFNERKRSWHDYLSGTWVRDLRREE